MNRSRSTHLTRPAARLTTVIGLVVVLALTTAAGLAGSATAAAPAAAPAPGSFTIRQTGTSGLDGRTVMSPSSERIVTTRSDGGDLVGPGMTVRRTVVITNRTEAPITFTLSLGQVVGTRDGQTVDIRRGVLEGAAGWATLARMSFTLKPGEQAEDPVVIRIPARVKPGSKSFAVIATQGGGADAPRGAGVSTQFEQVGIYTVELPGDVASKGSLTKAEITSAQQGLAAARDGHRTPVNSRFYVGPGLAGVHRLTLTTEYRNDGERLLQPSGTVVVKDLFGRIAGRYSIAKFTVYPGGSSTGQVELRGLPSLGVFSTTVQLKTDIGSQQTQLPRFVLVPKWLLAALAVIGGMLVWRIVRWQLDRRLLASLDADDAEVDTYDGTEPGADADAYAADDEDWLPTSRDS